MIKPLPIIASGSAIARPFNTTRADLCSLPVANISNVPLRLAPPDVDEDHYFDALDTQPWLTPVSPQWPRLNALALQIKEAIHYQIHLLSQTSMATTLLSVIHPDLSKLLAAALICSGRGKEIVCQAALIAGLQLINQLIYLAAGMTSKAAILSSLPGLLIIWLQHHQVSLAAKLLQSIVVLLSSWSTSCVFENIGQPGWLVDLHQQLIFPVTQLCRESGAGEVVMTGITLIVGLYSALALSGWLKGKKPSPTMLSDGLRIIEDICQLSTRSSNLQLLHNKELVGRQKKAWYRATHHPRWDESKADKALNRAVIRCIPRNILLQKDRPNSNTDRSSAPVSFEANYHRAYQQIEQQILARQLTVCPDDSKRIVSPMVRENLAVLPDDASGQAASSSEGASAPLLIPAALIAAAAVPNVWWQRRTNLLLPAAGVTLLAAAGYLRQRITRLETPTKLHTDNVKPSINLCADARNTIRQLLSSNKTYVNLAVELFDKLFDNQGDLNFSFADKLLEKWNITTFTSNDRDEMNGQLLYILSLLVTPAGRSQPIDLSSIILTLSQKFNKLWQNETESLKNKTVKSLLHNLRSHCAKKYAALGVHSLSDMLSITNFLITYVAPDLLFMEQNGRSDDAYLTEDNYYIWNYIGKQFANNRYVTHDEFSVALYEGWIDGFVLSRLCSYPGYNLTSSREYLQKAYKDVTQQMDIYHREDTILEAIPIVTFDDIIKLTFPGVDIHAAQNFKTFTLIVTTQARIEKEIRIIADCSNYGEIIRNMEDGFGELYHYLPQKIPEALRIYDQNNRKTFSLKKHPKLTELYKSFDQAYQKMIDHHCDIYLKVVNQAFKILSKEDSNFLHSADTQIYAIDIKVKRLKSLRFLLQPSTFRLFPEFHQKISYNNRPYHETGKIFVGYNSISNEKRFYILNIESSRIHSRQLPLRRLNITENEQIAGLDNSILNENYIFMDDQPFHDSCDEIQQPNATLLSRWDKSGEFITEHYHYYKNKLCIKLKHPEDMVTSYKERAVRKNGVSALEALKNEIVQNRRKYLSYLKKRAHNPSAVEQDNEKGKIQQIVELMPLYNCYAFFRDIIMIRDDTTPPSIMTPFFQLLICAADLYMGYGVKKTLSSLLQSLREMYAKRWIREVELAKLNRMISDSLIQPSSLNYANQLAGKIITAKNNLKTLDEEIAALRSQAYLMLGNLASIPPFTAFPYLSLRRGDKILSSNYPWGINMAKMVLKKSLATATRNRLPVPWSPPRTIDLVDRNNYNPELPQQPDYSCATIPLKAGKLILNIFDLRGLNSTLYHQLYFSALSDPIPESIIATAESQQCIIPENYNQMAMFFFISFTIPVRRLTSMILAQQDHQQSTNKINEETLYKYYADYLTKPYSNPPEGLRPEQSRLINQSINFIRTVVSSNIQGAELSYLFMIQYLLMKEDIVSQLQAMNDQPADKPQHLDRLLQALSYNLERFTLFSANYSSVQKKFHIAVINQFCQYYDQLISSNFANTLLFSANMEIFLQRTEQFQQMDPLATLPSPADYINRWLDIAQTISGIYRSFARIEYSAKALAAFSPDEWSGKAAQDAWLAALQEFLFVEMRYENLRPFLLSATEKLTNDWRKRQSSTANINAIISNDVVNPRFIESVKQAMSDSCSLYPKLFFCHVYKTDGGSWFSFLNNEFITETRNRIRRETRNTHRSWPVSVLTTPQLQQSITLPIKQMQTVSKPGTSFDEALCYQQQLGQVLNRFIRFASLPFHQRLQSHLLDAVPLTSGANQDDVIRLISSVIDAQGNFVDYQLTLLLSYLPQVAIADKAVLLQLLSDIFGIACPAAPKLYQFILHHLQNSFADSSLNLATVSQQRFVDRQITDITSRYLAKLQSSDQAIQQSIQRYITATLRNLLSFTQYLQPVEPELAASRLNSLASQWLSLGAIISHQLRAEDTSVSSLLMLAFAAQHDAGLLSLRETAIQQTALLSGRQPDKQHRFEAADALMTIAVNVKEAAAMQQHVFSCLEESQQLAAFIKQLTFSSQLSEVSVLRTMLTSALQKQRQLLLNALYQLSDKSNLLLIQAVFNGNLQVSWYLEENHSSKDIQVAGLAFNCPGQHELFLPLSDPEYIPLIFRQLSPTPDYQELTRLCFAISDTPHNFIPPVRLTLSVSSQTRGLPVTNPAIVLFEWMQSETESQSATLIAAHDETEFNQLKQALSDWLSQHLFFYGRSDTSDYRFIKEQSEHFNSIATNVNRWRGHPHNDSETIDANPVSQFSQAISTLMGASTEWQTLTEVLREAATVSEEGSIPLTRIPESGFAGFWWDPVSRFCYLGWVTGNQRALYASTNENREILYNLADDAASATIWPALTHFDWLQDDVQALRSARLSAGKFFDHSIALAWQLQCAMTGGVPLPDDAVPQRSGLPQVYTQRRASQQRDYFYPAGAKLATPVTVTGLAGGGWRLDFSPHNNLAQQDHYLSLETNRLNSARQKQWIVTEQPGWQLLSAQDSTKLMKSGVLTPASYLQWNKSNNHTTTMVPTSRVLQRNDGNFVFIFIENNQRISYRMLDAEGQLQSTPVLPADWPRAMRAADAPQINTAIIDLITRQNTPDYHALLEPDEQLRLESALSGAQQHRRTAIRQAYTQHRSFPFRSSFNAQAQSELEDILLAFLRMRQNFWQQVKRNAQLEDTPITPDELLWKPYGWRDYNLFSLAGREKALNKLNQEKKLLLSMRKLINAHHDVRLTSDDLKTWIQQRLTMLTAATTAIQLIKGESETVKPSLPLQLQRFAHNYFFSYYDRQPHLTAEDFQQPWPCIRDGDWPAATRDSWQPALDQLHTLTTEMPQQVRILDRLLTLPAPLWRADEMQQRARCWQQTCQQVFRYWQTARHTGQIVLLRSGTAAQDPQLMSHQYGWPVRLILAAGIGASINNQSAGTAPPLQISAQQNEDLLLTPSGPARDDEPAARLAAINADPQNAREFAAWSKLRLSSPWALQAFSGPDFFSRLHARIQRMMAEEADGWCQEERDFYHSPTTAEFLRESQPESIDSSHYAGLFIQLFNSNLLVTRLIMTDAEMVFGLMCDYFAEKHPERATEDLSKAWFLFLHTFEQPVADESQPIWLVGV